MCISQVRYMFFTQQSLNNCAFVVVFKVDISTISCVLLNFQLCCLTSQKQRTRNQEFTKAFVTSLFLFSYLSVEILNLAQSFWLAFVHNLSTKSENLNSLVNSFNLPHLVQFLLFYLEHYFYNIRFIQQQVTLRLVFFHKFSFTFFFSFFFFLNFDLACIR